MRLSISARIFAGFLVVLVAFGGVMGYTFFRMHILRQDLHLINKSYLRLGLILAELRTIQGNLLTIVAERGLGGGNSKLLWTQVRGARVYRLRSVKRALRVARASHGLGSIRRHDQFMSRAEERLLELQRAFTANEPLFDQLFPARGPTLPAEDAQRVSNELIRVEERLDGAIKGIWDDVRGQVKAAAQQIERDETNAIYAIVITMILAVLVSLGVTIGSQLTLRPLKTLVAGTKRIGSGDYSHRVAIRSENELGTLGQEFNSMAAAIEEREQLLIRSERMAAAGQIASHITHEIRNPLSSISLNTELLEEELEEAGEQQIDEARQLCRAIRQEVDRLTDITEEYLRFARLPRPRLSPEDINEILLDLISFVSTEMSGKGITLEHDLAPELPRVDADENQLRQAFLNLIRNGGEAIVDNDAANGRAALLKVATRASRDRSAVEVLVSDTGVGIPDDQLPRLFEPFFSTKETGTGLGLALTLQIIQEHGGAIEVQSQPRQGTTFTVSIPVTDAPEIS